MGALVALALAATAAGDVTVAHKTVVVDGVGLGLYRYAPPGNGAGHHPVLLVPELGFSRKVFDLYGRGLARWLSAKGYVVYVGEVRGQGTADPADVLGAVTRSDVPALFAAIRRETKEPLDLVVHGWAGTLVLAAVARAEPGVVGRVVAINTPVHAEVPSTLVEAFLSEGGHFSALASTPEGRHQLELMLSMGGQFPEAALDTLRSAGVRDLSPQAAAALLGWMKSGDLQLGPEDSVLRRLAAYQQPTLQLLALADGFAGPEQCSSLRDVSRAKVGVRVFSRFENAEDYSHLSVLLGSKAERDVFERIDGFLSAPAK